eukprot:TRINITY_DN8465_c0_g1_i1.p1 TRINITY_DN8465_c0_g1~~TRINITY_DN8465_c0_g1_i1.p1  ORF type:complete len:318 (-),score=48.19 TRINITY_DN8465_c0_g1_i1:41-994(-)
MKQIISKLESQYRKEGIKDLEIFANIVHKETGEESYLRETPTMCADHLMRIASISKVLYGYIFLKHFPQLDSTIETYFPADQYPDAENITFRMIMQHVSGIRDNVPLVTDYSSYMSPDDLIDLAYNNELGVLFERETSWDYCNTGYFILGRILERTTGKTINELLLENFNEIAPSMYLDDGREGNFILNEPNPFIVHPSLPWISGSVVSQPKDMINAFKFILNSPEYEIMTSNWKFIPPGDHDISGDLYGYAMQQFIFPDYKAIGHDGNMLTTRTMLVHVDEYIYFIHTNQFVSNAILRRISDTIIHNHRLNQQCHK